MLFDLFIKKWDSKNFKPKQAAANSVLTSLAAGLFVCGKFLLAGGGSSWAPTPTRLWKISVCGNSLPKLKVFAVSFRFRAEFTERSIFGVAGGIRCRNFAVINVEQVKFKIFAIH